MRARTLSPLVALAALVLVGACDSGSRSGVALCVNPTTQQVEQCCVAAGGKYVACSSVPAGGDAVVGADAGSTDGAGGAKDVAVQADGTSTNQDTGAGVEDAGAGVEDTSAGVEDASAGVEDTSAGVEDTGAGVEDTGAGVEDTGTVAADSGGCEECVLGDQLCDDEVTHQVCKETTPGCMAWKYIGCPDGAVCADGACIGVCDVELPCAAPGQKKCAGKEVQACVEVGPDCAGWMTDETCTASQTCDDGACVQVVDCPAVTKCTKSGEKKCDGTGKAVLACKPLPADAACLQWVTDETCGGSQVCQDAACVTDGGMTCNEYISCLGSCQTPSCETDCKATATANAQTQYNALNDCAAASCSFPANQPSSFQACYWEKCKTAVLGCDGYFVPGATGCGTFIGCQADCSGNQTCLNGCVEALDYTGYLNVLKLYACLEQQCDPYYASGTADYSSCVQTTCGTLLTTCQNDM